MKFKILRTCTFSVIGSLAVTGSSLVVLLHLVFPTALPAKTHESGADTGPALVQSSGNITVPRVRPVTSSSESPTPSSLSSYQRTDTLPKTVSGPSPLQGAATSISNNSSRSLRDKTVSGKPDFVYRGDVVTEDVTWRGVVEVEQGVTIAPQSTLRVEPGTVVRFLSSGLPSGSGALVIQGRIVAQGSEARPIVFTSEFVTPEAGDWQGIVLLASEKTNVLEHCRISGADIGIDAAFARITLDHTRFINCRTGAAFQDTLAAINGGGATGCGLAVSADDSEVNIGRMEFASNKSAVFAARASVSLESSTLTDNAHNGLTIENSRVRIRNNTFSGNGVGVALTGCEGTISGNVIVKNNRHGIRLISSRLKVSGNEIAGNGGSGVMVENGKNVLWGNILENNREYELDNTGGTDVSAFGNWWGTPEVARVAARISSGKGPDGPGRIRFLPVLRTRPTVVR